MLFCFSHLCLIVFGLVWFGFVLFCSVFFFSCFIFFCFVLFYIELSWVGFGVNIVNVFDFMLPSALCFNTQFIHTLTHIYIIIYIPMNVCVCIFIYNYNIDKGYNHHRNLNTFKWFPELLVLEPTTEVCCAFFF